MLIKFSVENFMGFKEKIELDLTKVENYNFNNECIKNNSINSGIIYGKNATGKTNLMLALNNIKSNIFTELGDDIAYKFLNVFQIKDYASFEYVFKFDEDYIKYSYKKNQFNEMIEEELQLNDMCVFKFDFLINSLIEDNLDMIGSWNPLPINTEEDSIESKKSFLSVIRDSATYENQNMWKLFDFIDGMLFVKSPNNIKIHEVEIILKRILNSNLLEDFNNYLSDCGVNLNLEIFKNESIGIGYNNSSLPLSMLMSSGTKALIIFYSYMKLTDRGISFIYMDEFDAFYHQKLTKQILKSLKDIELQFLLTTHNTNIIDNDILRPDCYFEIKNNEIKSFAELLDGEIEQINNMEKLYINEEVCDNIIENKSLVLKPKIKELTDLMDKIDQVRQSILDENEDIEKEEEQCEVSEKRYEEKIHEYNVEQLE